MLLEWRRNPEVNPKISIYDNLKPYYDLDVKNRESKYFIHLTGEIINYDKDKKVIDQRTPNVPKLGINPDQDYNTTPFGIYAYPLKDSWTLYNIETKKNLRGITFPDSEENRKYVYVLKTKSSINLINVKTYTKEQLEKDKKILNKFYDYDYEVNYEEPVFDNFKTEHLYFPFFKLKNITYNIAKEYSKNKTIITWSTIFKRLGYDGIYDPGVGLIDPSEECQCVFFKKDAIKVVALFPNKNYNKSQNEDERIFYFKKSKYIGKMKEGILHFIGLYISGLGIRSLKILPWSNQPYIILNEFNCSGNDLKDLEGGPIYAKEYNCAYNQLESLKGAPDKVEHFICSYNEPLKSLKGAPKNVQEFVCYSCSIESLQYIPDDVTKLDCSNNKITSLRYLPKTVKILNCTNNLLKNLEYSNDIMFYLDCGYNQLKSLKDAPKECDEFYCVDCGLTDLKGVPKKLDIINFSRNDVKSLKDLDECRKIRCLGNKNLKLDFKPKKLEIIQSNHSKEMIDDFLDRNKLEK